MPLFLTAKNLSKITDIWQYIYFLTYGGSSLTNSTGTYGLRGNMGHI